ncbi:class I SAM-dependent methyltransferase [Roseivivax sp. CAU 1761]
MSATLAPAPRRGSTRLSHAVEAGLDLPGTGPVVVFGAPGDADLAALPDTDLRVVQPLKPEADALAARGIALTETAPEGAALAVVLLPRERARAEDWIAAAERAAAPGGLVVVDGAKTDGADALLKAVRRRVAVGGPVAKHHGKIFWFEAGGHFADWAHPPSRIAGEWLTASGVFSADGVDPGSRLLAEALPDTLAGRVADLGGGWGYLSARILESDRVERVDLVEADRVALDCARANLDDPRIAFHWADATRWKPEAALDAVITNPPFHAGRKGDPSLGQAFLVTAARALKPAGRLWLVANRHLPYEAVLDTLFREVAEIGGDARFKILAAGRPVPGRR